jgi:DNA-binding beta-propeller fold protein YncE
VAADDATSPRSANTEALTRAAAARSRRNKLIALGVLLLLLAFLSYEAWFFNTNKRLALPSVAPTSKTTIDPPQYMYSITGSGTNALTKPIGLGVNSKGRVFVVDFGSRTVRAFDTDGTYRFTFSTIADGKNVKLKDPVHLAIDAQDRVWVTDRSLRKIFVFDSNGTFVRTFVPDGKADLLWSPLAIAFDSDGRLYVTDVGDTANHRVRVFEPDGRQLATWGGTAQVNNWDDAHGKFMFPNGLAVTGAKGTAISTRLMLVSDGDNRRIQVFDPSGTFKSIIRTDGIPRGLALDSSSRLYVVDPAAHTIDLYSLKGDHLTAFGGPGVAAGQFSFPQDVAIDAQGRIFVSDRDNNQVQVWGFAKGEVPGITRIPAGSLPWCFLPLLLLPLLLLLRKRLFVATDDFIVAMIASGQVGVMASGRRRWIVPESAHAAWVGRVEGGVDLGELLKPEPHSDSDVADLIDRLAVSREEAIVLAMAKRAKHLCTQDENLARLGTLLGVDTYDRDRFLERFAKSSTKGES